ncbi:S41 family peptidase [Paenibacillus crassostreae]|uniref:Peptidase S41 n=1 Tax=Paenibacillus crassostreae TaxID=1763538 RepID=A0A167CX89_9BACL|nr:S41 family peptidase [Paenibacillus crassostreae]AOZ93272.1 peptidase S41 [Paenibacillus crassostreae]OAB73682.1 peptidase S41 [Paenibacillus crassostreae]
MLKKRTAILMMVISLIVGSLLTMFLTGSNSIAGQASSGEGLLASITSGGLKAEETRKIGAAIDLIEGNYYKDIERSALVDGAINGMMEALSDPYSTYMGQETAQQFEESIEGSFSGIGAEVSMEDGNVVVVSPIKGSPAEKAGIRSKDILLSVNGESLAGLELNAAVAKIRGVKGSTASIEVKRNGVAEPIKYAIVRDDVALETVNASLRKDGIGMIEITQFSLNTAERFKEELTNLEKQGMKGLVIDVRNNPGGVLSVVIDITQQFVPKGELIVQVEDKNGKREKSFSKGSSKSYPITLLMNKGSASASEILAGALQQSADVVLVGENSFGKGTVQTSFDRQLGDGSLLKITIAKWLTPDGTWIHEEGIKPDIAVSQPDYFMVAPINKEKTLQFNKNSDDVKSAQVMLDGLGYKPGRVDGYFDVGTQKAVKTFQTSQKIKANGIIDSKTAEALEKVLIEHIQDPLNDTQLKQGIAEVQKEIKAMASKK